MRQVKTERRAAKKSRSDGEQVTFIGRRIGPKGETTIVGFSVDPRRMKKVLGATPTPLAPRITAFEIADVEAPSMQVLTPLLTRAIEVFGSSEKATRWMERPNRVLGQKTPMEMLATKEGRKEIEELLGRIEYGVYS